MVSPLKTQGRGSRGRSVGTGCAQLLIANDSIFIKGTNLVQPTILLVDDDQAVLAFVAASLSRDGFGVSTAASAEEALPCLAREEFDLVITDYRMTGECGDVVVNAVRERRRPTEVIIMTGLPNELPGWIRTGPRAVRVLDKPFTVFELRDAVGAALGVRENAAPVVAACAPAGAPLPA